MNKIKIRPLAFYLPQYYPIPENDEWWGKGFTEWTNTSKAKPLFHGHYQPHIPSDLGFYDLRLEEARIAQANMAQQYGIEGFIYWHYWFGNGKRILERPFHEVLETGKPDFPFCLAWANQTWTGIWHGLENQILIEQQYLGKEDYEKHFYHILGAFHDKRYIRVDNKPVFFIYMPQQLPDSNAFIDQWNELALKNGLDGIYFIGVHYINWPYKKDGFDNKTIHQPFHYTKMLLEKDTYEKSIDYIKSRLSEKPFKRYNYKKLIDAYDFSLLEKKKFIPTIVPNWDNTPRSGKQGLLFHKSTPEIFKKHFGEACNYVSQKPNTKGLLLIKSWNEWAEGNHVEPDMKFGRGYLEAIKGVLDQYNK